MTAQIQYRRQPSAGLTRVRVGRKQRRILRALLTGGRALPGYSLARIARVGPGALYPFLDHLDRAGWITSEWEVLPPSATRPPRRFWSLTPEGCAKAEALIHPDGS